MNNIFRAFDIYFCHLVLSFDGKDKICNDEYRTFKPTEIDAINDFLDYIDRMGFVHARIIRIERNDKLSIELESCHQ